MIEEQMDYSQLELNISPALGERELLDLRVMLVLCPETSQSPSPLYSPKENTTHITAYGNGRLAAIFGFNENGAAQAVVHPAYRKRGIFSYLWQEAQRRYPEMDFAFFLAPTLTESMAALERAGIHKESTEHFMRAPEVEETEAVAEDSATADSAAEADRQAEEIQGSEADQSEKASEKKNTGKIRLVGKTVNGISHMGFYAGPEWVGQCQLHPYGKDIEVVSLEIFPQYRRMGYGEAGLQEILKLEKIQKRRVYVQVSQENTAAYALYQKLNFETLETVLIYA